MTEEQLNEIELNLDIKLPENYRAFMVLITNDCLLGNTDTELWDSSEELIRKNKELRKGENFGKCEPWPEHLYFIGDPLTTCGNAIDLSDPTNPVWWVDHCDLKAKSSGKVAPEFTAWAKIVDENAY